MSTQSTQKQCSDSNTQQSYRRPGYNVDENDQAYTVEIYVPGVNKAGVQVSLEDDTLIVTAARSGQEPEEGWKAVRREIVDADYKLQLEVNVPVNRNGIEAKIEDGVLTLNLPKADEVKPRQIAVN